MASLILAAGVLTYDKVKSTREKRRSRKETNEARFAELEKDNAERMKNLHPDYYAQLQGQQHQDSTPQASQDPFRDSAEVYRGRTNVPRRSSIEGVGEEQLGERRSSIDGDRLIEGQTMAGNRPPEYASVIQDVPTTRKRGFRGVFGRSKGEKVRGDGIVR